MPADTHGDELFEARIAESFSRIELPTQLDARVRQRLCTELRQQTLRDDVRGVLTSVCCLAASLAIIFAVLAYEGRQIRTHVSQQLGQPYPAATR